MRDTKRLNSYDPKGMDNFKQLSLRDELTVAMSKEMNLLS
jgi:hypothetical protein